MAYSCTIERKATYLHVRVEGENTPDTVLRYFAEAAGACQQHGCSKLLIEENLAGPSLSVGQMFALVSARAEEGPPPPITIAYVDVNPEHDASRLRFGETTARNRGFLFHLFASVPEAEAWLAAG
jgi:hypothetical protein